MTLISKQCVKNNMIELKSQNKLYDQKEHGASFQDIYSKLPVLLSKNMQESLSPAVAFYSILHLANEHRLHLLRNGEEDFVIQL